MATATQSAPLSLPFGAAKMHDEEMNGSLSPPQIQQAYTPPPQRDIEEGEKEDEEESWEPECMVETIADTLHSNGDMNGHTLAADFKQIDGKTGFDNLAFCASPSDYTPAAAAKKRRKKQKHGQIVNNNESFVEVLRKAIVNHQLGLSLNLILLVAMSWCLFPSLRDRLSALFMLSYPQGSSMFGQGPRDLWLVVSFVVLFTGLRAFMLDYVLMPLAGARPFGIVKRKGRVRFAEQSYLLLYYVLYWTWGLQLFIADTPSSLPQTSSTNTTSPLTFNTLLISLWTHYPRLHLSAALKLYYLTQLAFWLQQILVIHLEERRKDHAQMLTHHFVTVALMATSYGYRQWRVGNAVLVLMDVVDLVFPLAKILRYLNWQRACDAAFAVFVVLWLVARHAGYLTVCWSIYAHVNVETMFYGHYSLVDASEPALGIQSGMRVAGDGTGDGGVWGEVFQPFVRPNAQTVAFNAKIRWGFLGLLLGLQCITLMWFVMICRVVVRVLQGGGADDSRSDAEDESEAGEKEEEEEEERFIEVEADSTTSYVRRSGSGRKVKNKGGGAGGFASGLHLGDRKEILNRIGCLSDEQLAREREKKRGGSRNRRKS